MALVNDGPVRGEDHFAVRVTGRTGELLSAAFGLNSPETLSAADADKQRISNAYKRVNIE